MGDGAVSVWRYCCFLPLAGSSLTPNHLLAGITTRRPEWLLFVMSLLCVCNCGHVKYVLRFGVLRDRKR